MDLHNIREDYSKRELSEADCADNPIEQFERWLDEAVRAQVNEPTAVNVAAVDGRGRPNSRMVLLKEVNSEGFVFFTNYHSRKGRSLDAHPFAAMTFFWPELERQVRVEGRVERLAEKLSDEYFESRPYQSRLGAWASAQSEVIPNKAVLVARAAVLPVSSLGRALLLNGLAVFLADGAAPSRHWRLLVGCLDIIFPNSPDKAVLLRRVRQDGLIKCRPRSDGSLLYLMRRFCG